MLTTHILRIIICVEVITMKLTAEQISIIERYTDAYRIDQAKLIAYLLVHYER